MGAALPEEDVYRAEDRFAEWTPVERSEYADALKAGPAGRVAALPAVVRETLLAMGGDAAPDDDVARELARVTPEAGPGPAPPAPALRR